MTASELYYLINMNSLNAEVLMAFAFRDLGLEGFGKFKKGKFTINDEYILTGETSPHIKFSIETILTQHGTKGIDFEDFSRYINQSFGNNLNGFTSKLFHQPLVDRGLVKPKSSLFNFGNGYTSEGKEFKKRYQENLKQLDTQFETYRKFKPEELKKLILKLNKYVVISTAYYDVVSYIQEYGFNNFIFNDMSDDNECYGYLIEIIENSKDTDTLIQAVS